MPTIKHLQRAYSLLQKTKEVCTAGELALFSQWCRFDPRLAEQLVAHIGQFWKKVSPIELNSAIKNQPWPSVLGVLLTQAGELAPLKSTDKNLFRYWSRCALADVTAAPNEQFFIGQRAFAGDLLYQDTVFSHRSFKKWGYFGREIFINKSKIKSNRTLIPLKTRQVMLKSFLKRNSKFTVADYRDFLGRAISIRQAQLDLQRFPGIQRAGNTRNRYYRF